MNEVRTLLTGRGLVESPRRHDHRLYFSDWSTGEAVAVDLASHSEVIAHLESLPLCTAWLPDGRLVIVREIDQLRGRLSQRSVPSPAAFERANYHQDPRSRTPPRR